MTGIAQDLCAFAAITAFVFILIQYLGAFA